MLTYEKEKMEHQTGIRRVLEEAFPSAAEADLVDDLRSAGALLLSMVALEGGAVVGHVALSPVTISPDISGVVMWGLAPLAVAKAAQGRGIGSALVKNGLAGCAEAGCTGVVVLGDPAYYGRFGFSRADVKGLRCTFDAPSEDFMLAELKPAACAMQGRVAHYHAAFDRFK